MGTQTHAQAQAQAQAQVHKPHGSHVLCMVEAENQALSWFVVPSAWHSRDCWSAIIKGARYVDDRRPESHRRQRPSCSTKLGSWCFKYRL